MLVDYSDPCAAMGVEKEEPLRPAYCWNHMLPLLPVLD